MSEKRWLDQYSCDGETVCYDHTHGRPTHARWTTRWQAYDGEFGQLGKDEPWPGWKVWQESVEQSLKAELAAAEQRGYERAIEVLRAEVERINATLHASSPQSQFTRHDYLKIAADFLVASSLVKGDSDGR